jgi:hypothetical protein
MGDRKVQVRDRGGEDEVNGTSADRAGALAGESSSERVDMTVLPASGADSFRVRMATPQ